MPPTIERLDRSRVQALVEAHGAGHTAEKIVEMMRTGTLPWQSVSIRDMALSMLEKGREFVESCAPDSGGRMPLTEAGSGVSTTAFANITGQVFFNAALEGFQSPANVISPLIPSQPTNLSGEKIPGMTNFEEEFEPLAEGEPYQEARFEEDYIDTPDTEKRGKIVSLTAEAIFFDRTGNIVNKATTLGSALGLNKEKRAIRVFTGITNNFTWKGTSYNTYLTSGLWINNTASGIELLDWTDIEEAELLWANMTDPDTGEAIALNPRSAVLVTAPAKKHTARQILSATELRTATASAAQTRVTANSVAGEYTPVSSVLVRNLLDVEGGLTTSAANLTWFLGDPSKAFVYMENYPLRVSRQDANSDAAFERDIVFRYKVQERGVYAVRAPWYMLRLNG